MRNSAILFISDIHYSNDSSRSQFTGDDSTGYYQKLENYLVELEKNNNIKFKYLVVTGDIADAAKTAEYNGFFFFLKELCKKFNILPENVLLLPGNHDINRSKLEDYCDENQISDRDASKYFEIKLKNFMVFYKNFFGRELEASNAILDYITIKEINTSILGLNSLVKESHLKSDHVGFIDISKLKQEIDDFLSKELSNIYIATHHSFSTTRNRELATLNNAEIVKETLNQYGINTYIYGHHHTSESKLEVIGDSGEIYRYIEVGSLGKILSNEKGESYVNRFSIAVCKENELDLHDYAYASYEWNEINNNKYVHKLPARRLCCVETLTTATTEELPDVEVESQEALKNRVPKSEILVWEKAEFLMEHLKKDQNYREGHFHWKNGKKTLGWIDIPAFLGDIEILSKVKACIIEIHKQYFENVQVVIGYGIEGNIIGTSLLDYWIEKKIDYHFYPSVHKKEEHTSLEKSLWNEYNSFQKVLLIFDILPTNQYVEEIIKSNDELKKCSEFCVLSLFYNKNLIKNEAVVLNSKIQIQKFALIEVDVPICELDEKECIIFREKIKKIYTL